jgi:hypothetical protein
MLGAMREMTRKGLLLACACVIALLLAACAAGAAQPVEMAAPYEYLGWGEPQPPATVMAESGIEDLTMAFVLSHGKCNPEWDGARPLLGGVDESAIESIRAAGGDVDVSFGGWSGKKLGNSCKTVSALAAAYQKVIGAYSLKAIDIDIEHGEVRGKKVRKRVIEALAQVQTANPGIDISVTFGTEESGPEGAGLSLIEDAAAIGFQPTAWTIMPFDFGPPKTDMGHASIRALEGLATDIAGAFHAGASSMNGKTDESSETVSSQNFRTLLEFAQQKHLARLSFWSVNRDRPCGKLKGEDECSGIEQGPYEFTDLLAGYHG